MQKRIHNLEDENKTLKQETAQIAKEFDECEEHEKRLVAEITAQLSDTNHQFEGMSLELERYKEENRLQYEQIMSLTQRLQETEMRLHQISTENEEQGSLLEITRENQNLLAGELCEFKERYQEVLALLQETQEQLRKQRKRGMSTMRSSLIPGMMMQQHAAADSLHLELMESSLYSDHSLDSGISSDRENMTGLSMNHMHGKDPMGMSGMMNSSMMSASSHLSGGNHLNSHGQPAPGYKKVFETVRCATKTGNYQEGLAMSAHGSRMSTGSSNHGSIYSGRSSNVSLGSASGCRSSSSSQQSSTLVNQSTISGLPYNSGLNLVGNSYYPSYDGSMGAKTYSKESLISDSEDNYPAQAGAGVPGVPGAKDLEAALRRLTPADVLARRAMLSHAPPGTYTYEPEGPKEAAGVRTPDSIMSTGSSGLSSSVSSSGWRLPEKLQIVKPMEGSQTLHHWSKLATPTLSGLLDDRPGVKIRGGRDLDELGMKMYSLNDIEEDEDDTGSQVARRFPVCNSVYTFTNSTIMHPDDGTTGLTFSIPPSQMSSQVSSVCPSRQTTAPPTPRNGLSRRNSCSTFSVNMGLASMLNERGIKALTPSALNTPAGPNYSPTVTPSNTPSHSPTRCRSPESSASSSASFESREASSSAAILDSFFGGSTELLKRRLKFGPQTAETQPERQSRIAVRNQLSRMDKRMMRPQTSKILERVESLGLDNVLSLMDEVDELGERVTDSGSAVTRMLNPQMALNHQQQRGMFTSALSRNLSPMAQLTSLKGCLGAGGAAARESRDANRVVIKKEAIKAVLNKAMQNSSEQQQSRLGGVNYDGDQSDTQSEASRSDFSDNKLSSSSRVLGSSSRNNNNEHTASSHHQAQSQGAEGATSSTGKSNTTPGGRTMSEARVKQMQRQKSRRTMMAGGGGQRPDLGTVRGGKTAEKAAVEKREQEQVKPASAAQTFVGSISSLLFGRKGGLL